MQDGCSQITSFAYVPIIDRPVQCDTSDEENEDVESRQHLRRSSEPCARVNNHVGDDSRWRTGT